MSDQGSRAADWTIFISMLALAISGFSVWVGFASTVDENFRDSLDVCRAYRSEVLSLAEQGFDEAEIIEVLNAEPFDRAADGTRLDDPGPGYDRYYRPACGPVDPILAGIGE